MTVSTVSAGLLAHPGLCIEPMLSGFVAPVTTYSNAAQWATANRIIYVPVRFPRRLLVRQLGWQASSVAAGNCDVGIYDFAGTRLVSTGSQTNTVGATARVIDVTDTWVGPGLFYLALNNDTTTDTFSCANLTSATNAAVSGLLTEAAGSVTLPATATWAIDNALVLVPLPSAYFVTEVSG